MSSSEVLEVLHQISNLGDYVKSLYECRYADFFVALAHVEQDHLVHDVYVSQHYRWYVKEMRIIAYAQLLESYSFLSIQQMAARFNVTPAYIDTDLSRLIAAGRLSCVIDKVQGLVITKKVDQ